MRTQCPAQTGAVAQGAKDVLQCLPYAVDSEAAQQVQINILFSTNGELTVPLLVCPTLFEVVLNWLEYGVLAECHVGVANYSRSIGGVQCVVVTARQSATRYVQWLSVNAQKQTGTMQSFLQECLSTVNLHVTDVSVMPTGPSFLLAGAYSSSNVNNNKNNSNTSATRPPMFYEQHRWGTSQHDVLTFVTATLVMSGGMCCTMCMLGCVLLLKVSASHAEIKQ